MITNYFGTDLKEKGHYFWNIIEGNHLQKDYRYLTNSPLPFHPETILLKLNNGDVHWLHSASKYGQFTVCAIGGSCTDRRLGCKSVFWVEGIISFDVMLERILSTPVCKEIINRMPFTIIWNLK